MDTDHADSSVSDDALPMLDDDVVALDDSAVLSEQPSGPFEAPEPAAAPDTSAVPLSGTSRPPPLSRPITHASKIAPDHPGLRLVPPRMRILKKGPAIAGALGMGAFVAIALVVGLHPPQAASKDDQRDQPPPAQNLAIPDEIRNAPDNTSPVAAAGSAASHHAAAPATAPPASGRPPQPPTLEDPEASRSAALAPRSREREQQRSQAQAELIKARASSIFVEGTGSEADEPHAPPSATPLPTAAPAATAAAAPQPQEPDPNLQGHKLAFAEKTARLKDTYVAGQLEKPLSPYELKAGSIIPATLLTGIDSDLPGTIVGQVRENVYDTVTGNFLLVPQGSRLMAHYDSMVAFGQSRLLLCWSRLIRPDGTSINLECMPGVDLAGYAGFADEVDHHWWRMVSGVALSSLLAATTQVTAGSVQGYQPSVPQLWASSAAGEVNNVGQQLTRKNLAIQPTITIRPGYSVNVLLSKDLILPPYNEASNYAK